MVVGIVAPAAADIAAADTGELVAGTAAPVVVDIVVADTATLVVADTGDFDIVVTGTAALVVPIAYPSCNLFPLPSNHLSTRLHPFPYPFRTYPSGIMENRVFAYILHPKTVLFYTW